MLPGHSLQVLYTEGLRQDWPSPFRPRGPLPPVAFPGGARRKAAVACRLFRQDRGSSQGFLTRWARAGAEMNGTVFTSRNHEVILWGFLPRTVVLCACKSASKVWLVLRLL